MSVIRWRISLADRVKAAQRVGGRTFQVFAHRFPKVENTGLGKICLACREYNAGS